MPPSSIWKARSLSYPFLTKSVSAVYLGSWTIARRTTAVMAGGWLGAPQAPSGCCSDLRKLMALSMEAWAFLEAGSEGAGASLARSTPARAIAAANTEKCSLMVDLDWMRGYSIELDITAWQEVAKIAFCGCLGWNLFT